MPEKPYNNKEYIDWVRLGEFFNDTVVEDTYRVTPPTKMQIRDIAVFIAGTFDGCTVTVQTSPDFMETNENDIVPGDMEWFDRPEGMWNAKVWENIDAPECWMRFKIENSTGSTDLQIGTRPRVEKSI